MIRFVKKVVPPHKVFVDIAANQWHYAAITDGGELYTWYQYRSTLNCCFVLFIYNFLFAKCIGAWGLWVKI